MKINPISIYNNICVYKKTNNVINNINEKALQPAKMMSYPQNYYVSFGKLSNRQKLENIGEENFPSPVIYEQFKSAVDRDEPISLYDLHMAHYSDLNNCKTLDEAKSLYPEFKDVKDAKDIPFDEKPRPLQWIETGKNDKVKIEDFTLSVLKSYYYGLKGLSDRKEYFGVDTHALGEILDLLNIKKLNQNYRSSVSGENPEKVRKMSEMQKKAWEGNAERHEQHQQRLKEWWQDSEYRAAQSARAKANLVDNPEVVTKAREGLAEYYADEERVKAGTEKALKSFRKTAQTDEFKAMRSAISKEFWTRPEYRELRTAQVIEQWENPAHRQYCSEKMKEHWQNNEEFLAKQEAHAEALRQAWANHPEFSETMSSIARTFHPRLNAIIAKKRDGYELTKDERILLCSYYKECHRQIPDLQSIIAGEAHQLLIEWGVIEPDEQD
ncbi:hypothetical protein II906_09745 [bacterium]|nr:hypothetical protein [bacterium]